MGTFGNSSGSFQFGGENPGVLLPPSSGGFVFGFQSKNTNSLSSHDALGNNNLQTSLQTETKNDVGKIDESVNDKKNTSLSKDCKQTKNSSTFSFGQTELSANEVCNERVSQLETATSGNKQRSTRNGLCSTTVESKTINSFGTKAVISSSLTNPPAPVNPAFNLQNNKIVDESGLFKKKKRLSDDTLCSENICLTNSSDKVPFTPAPNTIPASSQTAVSSGTTLFTPSSTFLSTPVAPFASLPTAPVAPIQSESNFTAPAFSFGSKHISENATIGAIPLATNSIPKKNSFNFTATSSNNPSTLTHVNEKDNPAFSFGSSSTPATTVHHQNLHQLHQYLLLEHQFKKHKLNQYQLFQIMGSVLAQVVGKREEGELFVVKDVETILKS